MHRLPNPPTYSVQFDSIQIDGLDIAYREAGDPEKPTILLLHGFLTSSHMFRNLIPALAQAYHVIAPDYPGHGDSGKPMDYPFDIDEHADLVEAQWRAECIKPTFVIGFDYSSIVAL